MKKLKFFAAGLALVFAFCSAFTIGQTRAIDSKYEIKGTDGSYYVLGTDVTGQAPSPTTYQCNNSSENCTVELDSQDIVTRNGKQEVAMSEAGTVVGGTFQNNQ